MSISTLIEWCDSTVNPTMGCDGCELWTPKKRTCYTGRLHDFNHRAGNPGYAPTFAEVTPFAGRMAKAALWSDLSGVRRPTKPWLGGMPRMIFISDMSDALSAAVSFEYLKAEIIDNVVSKAGCRHIWIWLTKRPQRMAEFDAWLASHDISWPENLWAMTSLTSQRLVEPRIDALRKVRALVRGVSCEPMLGYLELMHYNALDLSTHHRQLKGPDGSYEGQPWMFEGYKPVEHPDWSFAKRGIDWVICGGESGNNADVEPMHPAWPRLLRDQCQAAGVPFFFKQWGDYLPHEDAMRLGLHGAHRYVSAFPPTKYLPLHPPNQPNHLMFKVGKHRAGRLLDGVEHTDIPDIPF